MNQDIYIEMNLNELRSLIEQQDYQGENDLVSRLFIVNRKYLQLLINRYLEL